MKIALEVVEGPHTGKQFEFSDHDNFIVGRATFAHFQLPREDRYLSRVHFMIEINPPYCRVQDMGSENGTWVNGQRVDWMNLQDGDLVKGGRSVFRVSALGKPTEMVVIPPPPPPMMPVDDSPRVDGVTGVPTITHYPDPNAGVGGSADLGQPESIEIAIDGYRLVRKLGQGGMGAVYLAERCADEVTVALKTIRPLVARSKENMARFLREAEILNELDHPNIVRFYEMGSSDDVVYFTMDYVPGVDAGKRIALDGPMEIGRAVAIVFEILGALDYAHQRGFVHRDVKPSNLLLTQEGGREVTRLADFGLARMYQDSTMSGLTREGTIGGTVPFMPPEQITQYRYATPQADQYSTAATLYYLLTGKYLFDFEKASADQRLKSVLFEEPIALQSRRPEMPAGLAAAVHQALSKSPEKRFPGVAAFREAIGGFAKP